MSKKNRRQRELEKLEAARRQAEIELEQSRLEVTVAKAGLDLENPRHAAFVAAWDGPWTVEAIKAGYHELFGPPYSQAEVDAHQVMQTAPAGSLAMSSMSGAERLQDIIRRQQQGRHVTKEETLAAIAAAGFRITTGTLAHDGTAIPAGADMGVITEALREGGG